MVSISSCVVADVSKSDRKRGNSSTRLSFLRSGEQGKAAAANIFFIVCELDALSVRDFARWRFDGVRLREVYRHREREHVFEFVLRFLFRRSQSQMFRRLFGKYTTSSKKLSCV